MAPDAALTNATDPVARPGVPFRVTGTFLLVFLAAAVFVALSAPPGVRLVVGAGLLSVGGFGVAALGVSAGSRDYRRAPPPRATLRELPREGEFLVEGRTAGDGLALEAPLTGEPCLWYSVRMERLARGGEGGWRWQPLAVEARALPFRVDDDTGAAPARVAEGADLAGVHRFESVNPEHARVAAWRARQSSSASAKDGDLARQGIEIRFLEERLEIGDRVVLRARADGGTLTVLEAGAPGAAFAGARGRSRDRALLLGAGSALLGGLLTLWGILTLFRVFA